MLRSATNAVETPLYTEREMSMLEEIERLEAEVEGFKGVVVELTLERDALLYKNRELHNLLYPIDRNAEYLEGEPCGSRGDYENGNER